MIPTCTMSLEKLAIITTIKAHKTNSELATVSLRKNEKDVLVTK